MTIFSDIALRTWNEDRHGWDVKGDRYVVQATPAGGTAT